MLAFAVNVNCARRAPTPEQKRVELQRRGKRNVLNFYSKEQGRETQQLKEDSTHDTYVGCDGCVRGHKSGEMRKKITTHHLGKHAVMRRVVEGVGRVPEPIPKSIKKSRYKLPSDLLPAGHLVGLP